jgi:L-rhamnose-H+ transport protein
MIFIGLMLLTIDGLIAGSFYVPLKKVKNWAWESAWLINGVAGYVIVPWLGALLLVPKLATVLCNAPPRTMFLCFILGIFWGIGGVAFGLSVRFLGMSLGYAVAFGFCSAFGTLIPPAIQGRLSAVASTLSGQVTLAGVLVCLLGIAVCARAGMSKEKELATGQKPRTGDEFNIGKGIFAAFCAGLMIACMAIAIMFGKPIAKVALENGAKPWWQHAPTVAFTSVGGFITTLLWCGWLGLKNKTLKNYTSSGDASLIKNYLFAACAGLFWYVQMMLYSMGLAYMGKYDFAAWTVRMALIIAFSNMWGLIFKEWTGCSRKTIGIIVSGLLTLLLAVLLIGVGGFLGSRRE